MATSISGTSLLGLGNVTVNPTAVKREVALLLGGDPKQDSVSLSQPLTDSAPQLSLPESEAHPSTGNTSVLVHSAQSVNVVSAWGDMGDSIGLSSAIWLGVNSGNGQATIDLGNDTLQFDKSNSAITLTVKATGDVTTINGDPHVTDNSQTFTFKDNTTFQLSDGTDMTIKTVSAGNGQTLSDEVDLSKGSRSMTVTGLASNDANPLTISAGLNGWQRKATNSSDPTIYQTAGQWNTKDGAEVDQNYANQNL